MGAWAVGAGEVGGSDKEGYVRDKEETKWPDCFHVLPYHPVTSTKYPWCSRAKIIPDWRWHGALSRTV